MTFGKTDATPETPGTDHNANRGAGPDHADSGMFQNLTAMLRAAQDDAPGVFNSHPEYEPFFDALCRALHRRTPRHAVVVREEGVGEQLAMVDLARRCLAGRPPFLSMLEVCLLDARHNTLAELWRALGDAAANGTGSRSWVVVVDGLGAVLRGIRSAEEREAVVIALASLPYRIVVILSPRDLDEYVSARPGLQELFTVVPLHEPTPPTAVRIVTELAAGLSRAYDLQITDRAVRAAVALTDSFIPNARLPQKATRILESVCEDFCYDRSQLSVPGHDVTEDDVLRKMAEISKVPVSTLAGTGDAVDYRAALADAIVGQEHAVAQVGTELGLIKAGMIEAHKPASVMMFIGQTGTGKTEMAKAIARMYSSSKRLKTFTLGNFSEPHSVSGIIGVPPGYVGHEQGGRLVNELNADPYGVFLLDEADKAHPDVMQPFLNLFDEGWVIDQRGVKAYANRAIFVLTTNIGQRQISDMCRSGKGDEEITATMKETLGRIRHSKSNRPVFTSEFLARIRRIVVFRNLSQPAMSGICGQLLAQMRCEWLGKRQKDLHVAPELARAIAERSFALDDKAQGREGGRIVRKLLADFIESPLQVAISASPERYRRARRVAVGYDPAVGPCDANFDRRGVTVRFSEGEDGAAGFVTPPADLSAFELAR